MTFAQQVKALNALVTAGLVNAGVETLSRYQAQLLGVVASHPPDMVVETTPGCGHRLGMVCWAAHCAFSGDSDRISFIVTRSEEHASRIFSVANRLAIAGLKLAHIDGHDDSTPSVAKGVRLLVGTADALRRCRDLLARCVTLVFDDICNFSSPGTVEESIDLATKVNPSMSMCVHASCPPSEVPDSVRYLLRRTNRRYLSADCRPCVSFTTLLCHNNAEREDLALRVAQLPNLRRVVVMTHNREVRDLRQAIVDHAKLINAFAVHRGMPPCERQKVLTDFVRAPFAVLVVMDAFTGVDVMDVDAVIMYYPPQKSMPSNEWEAFSSCLTTTGDCKRPALVVTVAGTDDLSMMAYFMQKLKIETPVLNVVPTHPDFEDIVRFPEALSLLRGPEPHPKLALPVDQPPSSSTTTRDQRNRRDPLTPTSTGAPTPTSNMRPTTMPQRCQGLPQPAKQQQQQQQQQPPQARHAPPPPASSSQGHLLAKPNAKHRTDGPKHDADGRTSQHPSSSIRGGGRGGGGGQQQQQQQPPSKVGAEGASARPARSRK